LFLGLTCTKCPAFITTWKDDDKEWGKVTKIWSKEFNPEIKSEEIKNQEFSGRNQKNFRKHLIKRSLSVKLFIIYCLIIIYFYNYS
jgi:hypothetical protein